MTQFKSVTVSASKVEKLFNGLFNYERILRAHGPNTPQGQINIHDSLRYTVKFINRFDEYEQYRKQRLAAEEVVKS